MAKAITKEELKHKLDHHEEITVIEVLGPEDYNEKHIKGAINIPVESIGYEVASKFDENTPIVVYCSNKSCTASPVAAKKLEKLGFSNVYDFEGGKKEWEEAGYPMEQ